MKIKSEYTLLYIISILAFAIVIFSIIIINKRFVPAVSTAGVQSERTIILDAGHGGFDGGAVSADGTPEKDINLSISLKLRDMLEFFGYEVIMTRETDTAVNDADCETTREKKVSDIHNRFDLLENTPNSVLVSIHQNQFTETKYSGTQVFYGGKNQESARLAESIQSSVISLLQPDNTRKIKETTDSIYILYNTERPAVLVECGFLSNPYEASLLKTDEYQSRIAFSVLCGILDYFGGNDLV